MYMLCMYVIRRVDWPDSQSAAEDHLSLIAASPNTRASMAILHVSPLIYGA